MLILLVKWNKQSALGEGHFGVGAEESTQGYLWQCNVFLFSDLVPLNVFQKLRNLVEKIYGENFNHCTKQVCLILSQRNRQCVVTDNWLYSGNIFWGVVCRLLFEENCIFKNPINLIACKCTYIEGWMWIVIFYVVMQCLWPSLLHVA